MSLNMKKRADGIRRFFGTSVGKTAMAAVLVAGVVYVAAAMDQKREPVT